MILGIVILSLIFIIIYSAIAVAMQSIWKPLVLFVTSGGVALLIVYAIDLIVGAI